MLSSERDEEQDQPEREGGERLGAVELLIAGQQLTICVVTVVTLANGLA